MTENSIRQFIQKLAWRERISPEKIQEILAAAFRDSYCRNGNEEAVLHFEFDHDLLVYRCYQIVNRVTNPQKEITKKSKLIKEGEVKNGVLFWPLNTKNFSFAASQEIKKHFLRDLQKIQKEKEHETYSPSLGQLVVGNLQSIERDYYLFDLGKGHGYWKKSEQPLIERSLRLGQKLTFLLEKMVEESTGHRIILTRNNELFLRKVLELEIPEIKEGIIVIRDILRFPGFITKIVIESRNPHLNAVGTCLGQDGLRLRSISQIIYPERIEIIKWSENKEKLLFKLLAPAEVIRLVEEGNEWEVLLANSWRERENWKELLPEVGRYLGKKIIGQTWQGKGKLENYGKIIKIITEGVQVVEEIR